MWGAGVTELNWVVAALASTIIYAGVTVGDKLILTRLGIRLPAFYIFTGANQAIISLFIFAFDPPRGVPLYAALAGFGGGAFWGAGLTLMFWGLTREQVSRVAPVWHTSPIFVAIMAVFFLGESLGWAQWLAIALVVFGAIAISMRSSDLGIGFGIRPTFLVILLGAFLIGMGQLLLKEGSADQSIWSLMAFRGLGLFTAMFVPFARPRSFVALARYMRSPLRAGAITLNDAVAPFVGNLLLLWAIAVGPISLVSGVVASRPVFVLAITIGIGLLAKRLLPDEEMTRSDVALKAMATAAVVAGVVIIAVA